ncbi:O-antigen ligase family protein [Butyrivibrio sp. MB2005]|uniref:O-antigen ligase family protein n=1 Tax=Butyrivibrio sp. MB2005 TaxID=1280678 RepID=UPI00040C64ED|nr:O-antigen ligase family protein [Butyrivibrio sp. MB2005]
MKRHKILKKSTFIISIIMLFYYHWFYLIKYPRIISFLFQGHRFYVIFGTIALFLASYYLLAKQAIFKNRYKKILIQCLIYLAAWLIEVFYSWVAYDQSIDEAVSNGANLLMVFFFVSFLVIFIRYGSIRYIFNIINIFVFIWAIIVIIQSINYRISGNVLFDMISYFQNTSGVDLKTYKGNLRVSLLSFGNISIIYNSLQIRISRLNRKSTIKALIMVITELYVVIFVQQTRMYSLTLLICFFAVLLFRKNNLRAFLSKMLLAFFVSIVMVYTSVIANFVDSFSITGNNRWSTLARLSAIDYFLSCIMQRPLFGNGFLSEEKYYAIIHGTSGEAYYSDLGLLGMIAETGTMSLILYVFPVALIFYKLTILKKKEMINDLDIALFTFIIGTSFTLILTTGSNCIAFGFLIAYFEFRTYFETNDFSQNGIVNTV